MDKYLFTDGTTGVREVQTLEELQSLVAATADPAAVRIWVFSSNEWMSYAGFRKQYPAALSAVTKIAEPEKTIPVKKSRDTRWIKRLLVAAAATAGVLLVVNFTRIKWQKAAPLNVQAVRPVNVPYMDMDSLITELEMTRGQKIDRNTKNNLRMRNTWPDRIGLSVHAERETSSAGSRFNAIDLIIDNTSGYILDQAIVKLTVWKDNQVSSTDTFRFARIGYVPLNRKLEETYRGDSLSVSFQSIKAKSFNFCYSASVKNNSGNYNDRWFCRESE